MAYFTDKANILNQQLKDVFSNKDEFTAQNTNKDAK